jgi:hypothetical protein
VKKISVNDENEIKDKIEGLSSMILYQADNGTLNSNQVEEVLSEIDSCLKYLKCKDLEKAKMSMIKAYAKYYENLNKASRIKRLLYLYGIHIVTPILVLF